MKNCLILLSLLTALPLLAADAPKPNPRPAYLTEADARAAGPDFDLQGEYADAGDRKSVV